jgi:hypothetical protein
MFNQLAADSNKSPEPPLTHQGERRKSEPAKPPEPPGTPYRPYSDKPPLSEPPYNPYAKKPVHEPPHEPYRDI